MHGRSAPLSSKTGLVPAVWPPLKSSKGSQHTYLLHFLWCSPGGVALLRDMGFLDP